MRFVQHAHRWRSHSAMQRFFSPVDHAGWRTQVERIAAEQRAHAPPPASAAEPRAVGRPRKKRDAGAVLASAAAAELPTPKRARGSYTRWFDSPYITDIIAAYTRCGFSARLAVKLLRKDAPVIASSASHTPQSIRGSMRTTS